MSEETRKLTEGYFEFEPLGTARVKGVSEAVELYRLVGLGQLHTKLDVSAKRGLAKFVGRKAEIAVLGQSFELAKKGRGQIIGVVGEPGVGKSRLGHEFKVRCQKGVRVLVVFAVSHGKSSPYLPVIELLRSYFEIGLGDDEIRQREKITGKVLTLDRSLEDTLPYLFMLLGIPEERIAARADGPADSQATDSRSPQAPGVPYDFPQHAFERATPCGTRGPASCHDLARRRTLARLAKKPGEYGHTWQ